MKKILLFTCLVFMAGCSTQTFYINEQPTAKKTQPNVEKSSHFFIVGIGQEDEINPAKICSGVENIAKVETELSFLNGFLRALTWGIYSPRTKRVYCLK